MSDNFNEVLDKLIASPILTQQTKRYKNTLLLSGWILRKPKFIKHDKIGRESCSFILYQVNNSNGEIDIQSFSCMVYEQNLVEQFKTLKNVALVGTLGKFRYARRVKTSYSHIMEIETLLELDIPLAEEWKKGE